MNHGYLLDDTVNLCILRTTAQVNMSAASRDRPQNPLFDQALRKHLESLGAEDREAFEQCTAGDVIATVQLLDSSHAAQSRTRRFLVRFAAVVRPLESYFDLVSNVVGSIPGAQLGAIVFGALRFLVKAIDGLSGYFERIVGVLEEISQSLSYYQDYAVEIYRDSTPVQQALADVYHDIILVCSAVRDVFLKRGGAARCECHRVCAHFKLIPGTGLITMGTYVCQLGCLFG
ncbi:hypothetical protein BJY52DRAFT_5182 [Lactarius psammicola]|nr:hypothetical protein BJY52DRAFT_5182 [Lactarius psammicola]